MINVGCYNIPLTEDASPPPSHLGDLLLLVTRLGAIRTVAPVPIVPAVAPASIPALFTKDMNGNELQNYTNLESNKKTCSHIILEMIGQLNYLEWQET